MSCNVQGFTLVPLPFVSDIEVLSLINIEEEVIEKVKVADILVS